MQDFTLFRLKSNLPQVTPGGSRGQVILIIIIIIIIIIFIEETFSLTCGFRKGPQRLILKTKISTLNNKNKRTKNMKFIKHLN